MLDRLDRYCFRHGIFRTVELGAGKDGTVYGTSRGSAVKIHERVESYSRERDIYLRLRDCSVSKAWIFHIPRLLDFDDECLVLEMSIVTPPYLLDFASAYLDERPDFSEEIENDWQRNIQESFGERLGEVMAALEALERDAGVILLDIHPHNVKFE
jgi:hypothetical protein